MAVFFKSGDVYWTSMSVRTPAFTILQSLPGDLADSNAIIAEELRGIESRCERLPTRPCVLFPTESSAYIWRDEENMPSVSVCALATFDGSPYHELPRIFQKTVAPVNRAFNESLHGTIHTAPVYKSRTNPDHEWAICVQFQTPEARVKRKLRVGRHAVRVDARNLSVLLSHAVKAQETLRIEGSDSEDGVVKLRYLNELRNWGKQRQTLGRSPSWNSFGTYETGCSGATISDADSVLSWRSNKSSQSYSNKSATWALNQPSVMSFHARGMQTMEKIDEVDVDDEGWKVVESKKSLRHQDSNRSLRSLARRGVHRLQNTASTITMCKPRRQSVANA